MALDLAFSPYLPTWALLVLGLGVLLLGLLAILRRARGAWLRLASAALLLLLLANPALIREQREPLNDLALVVVDRSPSQGIEERQAQTSAALARLRERLSDLPVTDVRVVESRPGGAEQDDGTRLFREVGRVLAEVNREQVGAIFLLSDGRVHDVPEDAAALGIDAPIHLLRSGRDGERDRRLSLINAPSYGLVGEQLEVSFQVDDLPQAEEGLAEVRLSVDGEAVDWEVVRLGQEQSLSFHLDRRGPAVIELEVEAGPEELTLINNRDGTIVNGVRDRLRVLLVSGEPHVGERAWRNILKSDPSVDLVHFTILRPPEKQDGTPISELALIAFPTRELFELKLQEFDLVIFDRYQRRGILPTSYYENIVRYVEEGGALLEAVGPVTATPLSVHRTPLRQVLPGEPSGRIVEQAFHPRITERGQRHPVTAELNGSARTGQADTPAWGRWFRQLETVRRRGEVVMSGAEELPLLILDRVGEGRVAQLNSDQIWLWSRGFEGGGPQAELLRRTAHWLMKEPDLEEEVLRARVDDGELQISRRSLEEGDAAVTVTLPDGEEREVTLEAQAPGLAQARLPASQAGLHRVTDGENVALAPAGPANPREFEDPRATTEILQPVIAQTGGGARTMEEGLPELRKVSPGRDREGRGWLGVVGHGAYLVTGIERVALFPGIIALLLTLGLLLSAWRREGR
ncbi:hypothetical protein [Aquibaculum arenosum]|uniref:VWA domain-containing protein n=1 Tax=Aquibaculum arenosum TaxID=3032591 RepID=A0ABT5YIQ3_9PROT|nr:hypothetical protein [Fodinicurvata sp. CAU 1616]MDF2094706.1 hypothetical protein [Fodinicurvata sp. CAU 1616]